MGVSAETVGNWEKDKTKAIPSQFKPVVTFLGYDPTPVTASLAERFEAKRRSLGVTVDQAAQYLGWDEGSLRRYLRGQWRLSRERADGLEQFLNLDQVKGAAVLVLPRRRWRSGKPSTSPFSTSIFTEQQAIPWRTCWPCREITEARINGQRTK